MNTAVYRVRHKTTYGYSLPVTLSHHVARLKPRETFHQHISDATLVIEPEPSFISNAKDVFGNRTTFFIAETPHTSLSVTSEFTAEITAPDHPAPETTLPWETARRILAFPNTPALLEAAENAFPSCFIPVTKEIKAYALQSFTPNRPVLEAAEDLTHRIFRDFLYDPSATSIATPVNEVLKLRRGVCQDFAHLAIACVRSVGLAARYVSGYIRTYRSVPESRSLDIEMIGGDASHAWFSVYVPDFGWVDLDPTNDIYAQSEHITVGWGRDFDDMSPIKGVMTGGGRHTVSVDVSVAPLSRS